MIKSQFIPSGAEKPENNFDAQPEVVLEQEELTATRDPARTVIQYLRPALTEEPTNGLTRPMQQMEVVPFEELEQWLRDTKQSLLSELPVWQDDSVAPTTASQPSPSSQLPSEFSVPMQLVQSAQPPAVHPQPLAQQLTIMPAKGKGISGDVESEDSYTDEVNGSIVLVETEATGAKQRRTLCNFLIIPQRRVVVHDAQNCLEELVEIHVLVEGSLDPFPLQIKAAKIDEVARTITSRIPICTISPTANKAACHIAVHLRKQLRATPIIHRYCRAGWHEIFGRWWYLHDGRNGSLPAGIEVQTGKRILCPPYMTKDAALQAAIQVLSLSSLSKVIVPLFLFVHVGILTTPLARAGFAPQFLVFINGVTGSFKTAVAKILFTLFDADHPKIAATFKDTAAAMELTLDAYKDCVVLLDDFHPATTSKERAEMDAILERVVRFAGDGVGKKRSNAHMQQQKEFLPQGVVAITGEDTGGTRSSLLRCLLVEVDNLTFSKEVLSNLQAAPLFWSGYMSYFVAYAEEYLENIVHRAQQEIPQWRAQFERQIKARRLSQSAAVMAFVANVVLEVFAQWGMPSMQVAELQSEWLQAIVEAFTNSEQMSVGLEPAVIFCQTLAYLYHMDKLPLASCREVYQQSPSLYLGYKDDMWWWMEPHETEKRVFSYLSTSARPFTLSQAVLRKDLVAQGVITIQEEDVKGQKRKNYLVKTALKGRPRFYRINSIKLLELADNN